MQSFDKAVELLQDNGTDIIASDNFPRFKKLINQLPYRVLTSNPYLAVLQGWNYALNYQYSSALSVLKTMENMVEKNPELADSFNFQIIAVKSANGAWSDQLHLYQYEVEQELLKQPLPHEPTENALRVMRCLTLLHNSRFDELEQVVNEARFFAQGGAFFYSSITITICHAMMHFVQGNFEQCSRVCDKIDQFMNIHRNESPLGHIVNIIRGMLAYVQGDLARAQRYFEQSGNMVSYISEPSLLSWYYVCHIQLLTDLGQQQQRELLLDQCIELTKSRRLTLSKTPLYYEAILNSISFGHKDDVSSLKSQYFEEIATENYPPENLHMIFNQDMVQSLLLFSQGKFDEVKEILLKLSALYEQTGRIVQQVRTMIYLTNIYTLLNDKAKAKFILRQAITIASPKHLIQYFARLDKEALAYINEWLLSELSPNRKAFMKDICQRFEGQDLKSRYSVEQADSLSTAEQKVMELLGSGLSNQEIADKLYISINTVKSHLKSSYAKLGVSNRMHASRLFSQL